MREKWKRRKILSKFERKERERRKRISLKSLVCALLSNFSDYRKMIKIKK